jgi:hypothetical protein
MTEHGTLWRRTLGARSEARPQSAPVLRRGGPRDRDADRWLTTRCSDVVLPLAPRHLCHHLVRGRAELQRLHMAGSVTDQALPVSRCGAISMALRTAAFGPQRRLGRMCRDPFLKCDRLVAIKPDKIRNIRTYCSQIVCMTWRGSQPRQSLWPDNIRHSAPTPRHPLPS